MHPKNSTHRRLFMTPFMVLLTTPAAHQKFFAHALRPSQFNNGPMSNPPPSSSLSSSSSSSSSFEPYSTSTGLPINMDHESIEERLASWRTQQQHKYENQSPIDAANPRDDDGRMKLLATVSKGSISLFFFILMWRSVHHYELADQSFKGSLRLMMVIPTVVLFLGNMVGCVVSLMSSSNTGSSAGRATKKKMKAVLNLNKLVELCLIFYNVMRLIFFPSKYVVREIYVGRTLTNFLFIIQCQLFTKVTWGTAQLSPGIMGSESTIGDGNQNNNFQNYGHTYEEEGYTNDAYSNPPQQQYQPQQQSYNYDDSNRGQW